LNGYGVYEKLTKQLKEVNKLVEQTMNKILGRVNRNKLPIMDALFIDMEAKVPTKSVTIKK